MTEFEEGVLAVMREIRDQLADTSGHIEDLKAVVENGQANLGESVDEFAATAKELLRRMTP